MGQSPSSQNYNFQGKGLPLIQGNADICNRQTAPRIYTSQVTKKGSLGDILLSVRAPVGEVAIALTDVCLGRGVCAIRAPKNNNFLYYVLIFNENKWLSFSGGSTFESVNSKEIISFPIPLPPLPEQTTIATVLSDVDGLIASLTALIAKKRAVKHATMQQLLTGKTRLAGFTGAWEVKRLGSLGTFSKGQGIRKDEAKNGNIPCVRYGEIYTVHNTIIRSYHSFISSEVAKTSVRLKCGDILFTASGETKEEIGKCVAFIDEMEVYAGGDIIIFTPISSNSYFLGYAINDTNAAKQKASMGQGDAVVHISARSLATVKIPLPPLPEQTAIAAILSDMDAEITTLETRLAKTKALKTGMCQELLTGKTRLL